MNWLKQIFKTSTASIEPPASNAPTVVWLHGANQTELSFAYLRSQCVFNKEIAVNYSSLNRFYDNLDEIVNKLTSVGPIFVVGHSLGGLYGLHLTQRVDVVGGVSISTPFNGSSTADWAKYMVPSYALFRDIGRRSPPVQNAADIVLTVPWTQVVTTAGSVPYLEGPNDGVVTVQSMRYRNDMQHIEVPHTHYEGVCSNTVADIVSKCYRQVNA